MDLLTYINLNKSQRIIATNQVAFINALIRQSQIQTMGIEVKSITGIAKDIFAYHCAKQQIPFTVLSSPFDRISFQNMLMENIATFPYYQSHKDLLNDATVEEIFRVVNIIRSGDSDVSRSSSLDISQEDTLRIHDAFALATAYESYLQNHNLFDSVRILQTSIDELRTWSDNEMGLPEITCMEDEKEEYSYLQHVLMELLQMHSKPDVKSITYPSFVYSFSNNETSQKTAVQFFKGFGLDNEVKYVIYDVIQKQYPFGSVSINYTSPEQAQILQSELEHFNIPYYFTNGVYASENPVIALSKKIIDWAMHDFEESYVVEILKDHMLQSQSQTSYSPTWIINLISRAMFYWQDDEGKRTQMYYHIGHGLKRYGDFIQYAQNTIAFDEEESTISKQFFIDVIKDLCAIFETSSSLSSIHQNVFNFLAKYIDVTNFHYVSVVAQLEANQAMYDAYTQNETLTTVLEKIMNDLDEVKIQTPKMDEAIQIEPLNSLHILEKEHTYCIGMSAILMKNKINQSPVLSDEEMKCCIHGSYLPTVDVLGPRNNRRIAYTLSSNPNTQLVLGYPSYDTQEQSETNPSIIYNDIFALYNDDTDALKQLPVFTYGLPSQSDDLSDKNSFSLVPSPNVFLLQQSYSASSLERLSDCPRMYAYEVVHGLRPMEFLQDNGNTWLSVIDRGNFVHQVLERYTNTVFAQKEIPDYQECTFQQILSTTTQEYIHALPKVEDWIVERDINTLTSALEDYIQSLHTSVYVDGWHFLYAEKSFHNCVLERSIPLLLKGIIDRIDYRINEEKQVIELRTIDYKTGKRSVERKVHAGISQQRSVYTCALMNSEFQTQSQKRIMLFEQNPSLASYPFVETGFFYTFIGNQVKVDKRLTVENDALPILNDRDDEPSIYRLSKMIEICQKEGRWLDRYTIGQIMDESESGDNEYREQVIADICGGKKKRGNGRKTDGAKCTYCPYQDLCDKARK